MTRPLVLWCLGVALISQAVAGCSSGQGACERYAGCCAAEALATLAEGTTDCERVADGNDTAACQTALDALAGTGAACLSSVPRPPVAEGPPPAGEQPALCSLYLDCVAQDAPDELAAAQATYGLQGACWQEDDGGRAACRSACSDGIEELTASGRCVAPASDGGPGPAPVDGGDGGGRDAERDGGAASSSDCGEILACVIACRDLACVEDCRAQGSSEARSRFDRLSTCLTGTCASACAAGGDSCAACAQASCSDDYRACQG